MIVTAVIGLIEELGKEINEPILDGVREVCGETIVHVKALDAPVIVWGSAADSKYAGVNTTLRHGDAIKVVEAEEPITSKTPINCTSILESVQVSITSPE